MLVETTLTPLDLLDVLQAIEAKHERQRAVRWGPRTLDLDILLFGRQVIEFERLTVPHPRMLERGFVLQPLADISPDLQIPDCDITIAVLAKQNKDSVTKLERVK